MARNRSHVPFHQAVVDGTETEGSMGLFRKKRDDEQQLVEMRTEIRLLRQRLDESDAEKARLAARLDEGDAGKARLEERVGTIDEMNRQLTNQAGDVSALTSQVQALTDRLSTPPAEPPPPPPVDDRVEGIERRLEDLDAVNDRLDELSTTVTRQAQEALSNQLDPTEIGDMANRLEDLAAAVATHGTQLAKTQARVDAIEIAGPDGDGGGDEGTQEAIGEMRQQLGQMAERMTSLDRRLTNVSTELANQLTELSRDIDDLGDRPAASSFPPPAAATAGSAPVADDGVSDDLDTDELELRLAEKFDMAIDEVRASQERLAAEQARYEIKFREDLAELADRLRKPRM